MWLIEIRQGQGWNPAPGITPQSTKLAAYKEAINAFGAEWWVQFFNGKHMIRVNQTNA